MPVDFEGYNRCLNAKRSSHDCCAQGAVVNIMIMRIVMYRVRGKKLIDGLLRLRNPFVSVNCTLLGLSDCRNRGVRM